MDFILKGFYIQIFEKLICKMTNLLEVNQLLPLDQ